MAISGGDERIQVSGNNRPMITGDAPYDGNESERERREERGAFKRALVRVEVVALVIASRRCHTRDPHRNHLPATPSVAL